MDTMGPLFPTFLHYHNLVPLSRNMIVTFNAATISLDHPEPQQYRWLEHRSRALLKDIVRRIRLFVSHLYQYPSSLRFGESITA